MLRVAPIRDPTALHINGWEEYNEINEDGTVGAPFYFNRTPFEASYAQPVEVKEDLDNRAAWEQYHAEQAAQVAQEYGGFTAGPSAIRAQPDPAVIAREQEVQNTYSYDPYAHAAHDETWARNQEKYNHTNYERHRLEEEAQKQKRKSCHQLRLVCPQGSHWTNQYENKSTTSNGAPQTAEGPRSADPTEQDGSTPRGTTPMMAVQALIRWSRVLLQQVLEVSKSLAQFLTREGETLRRKRPKTPWHQCLMAPPF